MAKKITKQIVGKQHVLLDDVIGIVLNMLNKGRVGIGTDYSIKGSAANS